MARTRKLTVRAPDVQKLEGLIQELVGTAPEWRPNTFAHMYIAQHLGVSSRIAQQWIRGSRKAAHRSDTADAFFSAYVRIADLLSEELAGVAFKMARDPDNKNALAAQKWLLPKINPMLFGNEVELLEDDDDVSTVGGIDQEVFDEMSEEQVDRVDELQQIIADAMAECAGIAADVQQQVHAKQVAARAVH